MIFYKIIRLINVVKDFYNWIIIQYINKYINTYIYIYFFFELSVLCSIETRNNSVNYSLFVSLMIASRGYVENLM